MLIPANLTPTLMNDAAQVNTTMAVAQVLGGWAKAVRAQVTIRAIEDEAWMPEGYVLRKREKNKVKNHKAIIDAARAAGVSEEAIEAAMTVKITPINEGIQDIAPRGSKTKAKEAFTQALLDTGALEKGSASIFLERIKT